MIIELLFVVVVIVIILVILERWARTFWNKFINTQWFFFVYRFLLLLMLTLKGRFECRWNRCIKRIIFLKILAIFLVTPTTLWNVRTSGTFSLQLSATTATGLYLRRSKLGCFKRGEVMIFDQGGPWRSRYLLHTRNFAQNSFLMKKMSKNDQHWRKITMFHVKLVCE